MLLALCTASSRVNTSHIHSFQRAATHAGSAIINVPARRCLVFAHFPTPPRELELLANVGPQMGLCSLHSARCGLVGGGSAALSLQPALLSVCLPSAGALQVGGWAADLGLCSGTLSREQQRPTLGGCGDSRLLRKGLRRPQPRLIAHMSQVRAPEAGQKGRAVSSCFDLFVGGMKRRQQTKTNPAHWSELSFFFFFLISGFVIGRVGLPQRGKVRNDSPRADGHAAFTSPPLFS